MATMAEPPPTAAASAAPERPATAGASAYADAFAAIRAAETRLAGAIWRSPCHRSLHLSRLTGCEVWCKLDLLQPTGSFKERGARNRLLTLTAEERARGVIAVSAGNHALALACHGRDLGIAVTVVMPPWAPLVKVVNCRALGAEVVLHGDSFAAARAHALDLAAQRGQVFVPPYDDADVIAGQGTVGLEIAADVPAAAAVLVPVGGGGLIAGVAVAVRSLLPACAVIGVSAAHTPAAGAAKSAGAVVGVRPLPTLADGLAVAQVGARCLPVLRDLVDAHLAVSEADIARAIVRLLEHEKLVTEGAGAVALAALLDRANGLADRLRGRPVVLVLGGGNIDLTVLGRVIDRGLAADGRRCRFTANLEDRPGSLARLLAVVAESGASIQEVDHDRAFGPADVALVEVTIMAETRDHAHIADLHHALRAAGFAINP
jgi:threonine dehydratase